jgi:hypothetical protein
LNPPLNNLLDTSDKNPTEFWKVVHKLKDKCNEDPSSTIAPQEWCKYFHNLMNVRYDNNFEVDSMNNYIHWNNDLKCLRPRCHGDLFNKRPKLFTCLNFILHSSSCHGLFCFLFFFDIY